MNVSAAVHDVNLEPPSQTIVQPNTLKLPAFYFQLQHMPARSATLIMLGDTSVYILTYSFASFPTTYMPHGIVEFDLDESCSNCLFYVAAQLPTFLV